MVRHLASPLLIRAAMVLVCAVAAFLLGLILMRLLRKNIAADADMSAEPGARLETLPLHLYNTVIQQLKQQKHELQVQSKAEQHRARATETLSQAVLSNLSSGVLVFGTNGLVKSSNPAAREILGFGSTSGMSAADIFRGAEVGNTKTAMPGIVPDRTKEDATSEGSSLEKPSRLAQEVDAVLYEGSGRREVQAEYETPAGRKRFIEVTVSPVPAEDGSLLGVACVINDRSELEQILRQQALHGEISAEMALALRNSLATISGYAQQLASSNDPELARQLAADISHEAASLDSSIGGFLTERRAARSAGAASSSRG